MTAASNPPDDPAPTNGRVARRARAPAELPHGLMGWLELSSPRRVLLTLAVTSGAGLATWLLAAGPEPGAAATRALFILLLAVGLWVTEAVPAFAVSLLVIALQVLLLARPGSSLAASPDAWETYVRVLGHPLIWLFLGGLVLAAGMAHTGLDRWLALHGLRRFGARPVQLVLAVAGIAFVLSMLMSNTATTAMLLALIAPLLAALTAQTRLRAALVLAVPVGANLGGMGSLIGTPPNGIAVGALQALPERVEVHFLHWLALGLTPGLALAGCALSVLARSARGATRIPEDAWASLETTTAARPPRWETLVVLITLTVTVGLWLTSPWHGLPPPAVAVVPVVALSVSGVLGVGAFRSLNFDVLFLIAGGLALGQSLVDTGLADWIVEGLNADAVPALPLALALGVLTVLLANVMSNTAAANVLVPLGITMLPGDAPLAALTVALCASAGMALPIATPPNALAYATGACRSRDFLLLGGVTGILAPLFVVAWLHFVALPLLGLAG